ncbi:MAG: polysaccharide deacetylase family protein [Nanoarchaeota archaeon]
MLRREFLKGMGTGICTLVLGSPAFAAETEEPKPKETVPKIPIYLTIDDGPTQDMDNILKILGTEHKVTFFLVGKLLENPWQYARARTALELGHQLANHSYSHPFFSNIPLAKSREQILKTEEILQRLYQETNRPFVKLFRFPYGDNGYFGSKDGKYHGSYQQRKELAGLLTELGYTSYLWDAVDGSHRNLKPNSVVLTHDRISGLGTYVADYFIRSGKYELKALPITD